MIKSIQNISQTANQNSSSDTSSAIGEGGSDEFSSGLLSVMSGTAQPKTAESKKATVETSDANLKNKMTPENAQSFSMASGNRLGMNSQKTLDSAALVKSGEGLLKNNGPLNNQTGLDGLLKKPSSVVGEAQTNVRIDPRTGQSYSVVNELLTKKSASKENTLNDAQNLGLFGKQGIASAVDKVDDSILSKSNDEDSQLRALVASLTGSNLSANQLIKNRMQTNQSIGENGGLREGTQWYVPLNLTKLTGRTETGIDLNGLAISKDVNTSDGSMGLANPAAWSSVAAEASPYEMPGGLGKTTRYERALELARGHGGLVENGSNAFGINSATVLGGDVFGGIAKTPTSVSSEDFVLARALRENNYRGNSLGLRQSEEQGDSILTGDVGGMNYLDLMASQLGPIDGQATGSFVQVRGNTLPQAVSAGTVEMERPEMLTSHIGNLANQGGGAIRLRIVPENLGEMVVSVEKTAGNHLHIRFDVGSQDAQGALMSGLSDLRQRLQGQNYKVDAMEVSVSSSSGSAFAYNAGSDHARLAGLAGSLGFANSGFGHGRGFGEDFLGNQFQQNSQSSYRDSAQDDQSQSWSRNRGRDAYGHLSDQQENGRGYRHPNRNALFGEWASV